MSQENVEMLRRTVDRVNAGEIGQHLDTLFASRVDFRDELGELDNRDDLRAYLESWRSALTALHVTWVMTFRDGRCVRWHIYADHAEALEAAGLSE